MLLRQLGFFMSGLSLLFSMNSVNVPSAGASAPALSQPQPAITAAVPSSDCGFVLGFGQLRQAIGEAAGSCLTNQVPLPNGDMAQQTTTGTFLWRKAENRTFFTNGYQTWLSGPYGVAKRLNSDVFDWEALTGTPPDGGRVVPSQPLAAATPVAHLGPLHQISQTLNNCGPASISEVLGYWGIQKSQGELASILRPDNPWGMSAGAVPPYTQTIGMQTLLGHGGDDLVKAFVRNGLPVIVTQWVSPSDHVRHYRPIEAYDDTKQVFVSADPYLGDNHVISYGEFDSIWQSTGQAFMVIFPPEKKPLVESVLASVGALSSGSAFALSLS